MKRSFPAILIGPFLLLSACGGEPPFSYEYKSPIEVDLTYKGVTYHLNSLSKDDKIPFEYEFELDGDLNLTIEGEDYELESPYDLDKKSASKKKDKKKKTVVKKSTSSKK